MAGRVTAPKIEIEIAACEYSEWRRFAPFHYLSSSLHKAARTFAVYVNGEAVAFCGIMARPVSRSQRTGQNLSGVSRVVTLPDWQGLGLAYVLTDAIGAAYKAIGRRLNNYPAHPAYIRSMDRSPNWAMIGKPGYSMSQRGGTDKGRRKVLDKQAWGAGWNAGSRPNATFRYVGPAMELDQAHLLLKPYLR